MDTICNATSDDGMDIRSSLNETTALSNDTSHENMNSLSKYCELSLCSKYIPLHRTEGNKNFLFVLAAESFPQSKMLAGLTLTQNFVEGMDC